MSNKYENYEIIFAAYDTEDGAAKAVEALKDLDHAKAIDIIDAATLVKDADGNATVKQESMPSVKRGLGVGALIGGAIGLIFPPSILGAAALGAGIGAGSAKLAKMALENDDLKEAADSLEPGSSAFIAVVENTWVSQLQDVIAGYENLARHTMDAEAAGVLGTLANDSEGVVYGSASSADAAVEFAVASDGETIIGSATAAAIDEDGNVVVQQIAGAGQVDAEGTVSAISDEAGASADGEGDDAEEPTDA
jgi:uncharacterized membrane protein